MLRAEQCVLIVDDDRRLLTISSELLRFKLPACQVLTACSWDEAAEVFRSRQIDVAVLDLVMPGSDIGKVTGLKLLEWIRSNHPQTEVIIFTGFPTPDTRQEAFQLGAFDYHQKGDSIEEWIGSIHAALTGGVPTRSASRMLEHEMEWQLSEHASSLLGCPVEVSVSAPYDQRRLVRVSSSAIRTAESRTRSPIGRDA